MCCGAEAGGFEHLKLRLEPESYLQLALSTASALGNDAVFTGLQVNRRCIASAFHIEKKQQILKTQGPSRHNQLLALAHAEK
jgi:hypothetical protein